MAGKKATVKPAYGRIAVDLIFGLEIPPYPLFDKVKGRGFMENVKIAVENKHRRLK